MRVIGPDQAVLLAVRTTRAKRNLLKIAAIQRGTTVQAIMEAALAKALAEPETRRRRERTAPSDVRAP